MEGMELSAFCAAAKFAAVKINMLNANFRIMLGYLWIPSP
jgi:hypothetical protein